MTRDQKEAKAHYIDIVMRETWGDDEQMRKHYEKTLFTAVELSKGYLIPVEKSSIKKSFCFGYSLNSHDTDDYDRANEQAEHARKSVEYFIAENLKPVDDYISSLEEMETRRYIPVIRTHYNRAPKDTIIKCIDWVKDWEYNEYTEAQKAEKELLSNADRAKIIDGLKAEREDFIKRLQAYLKRYGLSKINTWSYWQDA